MPGRIEIKKPNSGPAKSAKRRSDVTRLPLMKLTSLSYPNEHAGRLVAMPSATIE